MTEQPFVLQGKPKDTARELVELLATFFTTFPNELRCWEEVRWDTKPKEKVVAYLLPVLTAHDALERAKTLLAAAEIAEDNFVAHSEHGPYSSLIAKQILALATEAEQAALKRYVEQKVREAVLAESEACLKILNDAVETGGLRRYLEARVAANRAAVSSSQSPASGKCLGYPECDGDLGGPDKHEPNCPASGTGGDDGRK